MRRNIVKDTPMTNRQAKLEIVPIMEPQGIVEYDLRLRAANGKILFYGGQGYTSRKDARRGINSILHALSCVEIVVVEPEKDKP